MSRRLIAALCCLLAWRLLDGGGSPALRHGTTHGQPSNKTDAVVAALRGRQLYTDPASEAATWWRENRLEYPDQAEILRRMALVPTAHWLTHPETRAEAEGETGAAAYLRRAAAAQQLPVLVLYDIVGRDAGRYSRGGAETAAAYRQFVDAVDRMIGGTSAMLIVEPDALAYLPGMPAAKAAERLSLLRYAVAHLARPKRFVYLDAGHAGWLSAAVAADLLRRCGIEAARGIALNVSNFRTVKETIPYAREIVRRLDGNKTVVIDTSRCGNGPAPGDAWCNPPGRALGPSSTTQTVYPIDALLWVKRPWESDGDAAEAPAAGKFHLMYALELARNAGWR